MLHRRLALTFALAAPALTGCLTQTYSGDAVARGQAPPDYIAFINDNGPLGNGPVALPGPLPSPAAPAMPSPAPGDPSIPGQGTIVPPAGPVASEPTPAPPRRSLWQRLTGQPPSVPTPPKDMTLPSPHYLKHQPQYFPPDPAFPLQRELAAQAPQPLPASVTGGAAVVLPKLVTPPTPEQVNAVPAEVVKYLQTGAFDPNIAPAGGKQPTIGPPPAPNNVAPAAPANVLDGTVWVRETKACRAVVKFTKDRVVATVTAGPFTLHAAGDYALGKDGVVFGVVTQAESPTADDPALLAKLVAADGAPFCVRARVEDGVLTLRDFRCAGVEPTAAVLGAYRKTTAADVEKAACPASAPAGIEVELIAPAPKTKPVQRSGLDAAVEFVQAFIADNPQLVQMAATEIGRAVGGWVGEETGQPRLGEVLGSVIGSAIAQRLTGQPAPVPPPAEFRSVKSLSYWLGAERPARPVPASGPRERAVAPTPGSDR